MAAKAGVTPTLTRVGPDDDALATITGARMPSGVPVPEDTYEAPRPQRSGGRPGGHRGPRHGAPTGGSGRPGRPAGKAGQPRDDQGPARSRRQSTASARTTSKASRASGAPAR